MKNKYREFASFSVYPFDLAEFNGNWDNFSAYLNRYGMTQSEILLDFSSRIRTVPREIAGAVHFPSFMSWYRFRKDSEFSAVPDMVSYAGENEIEERFEPYLYTYGGRNYNEVISNFTDLIASAYAAEPAYGVFHPAYMEIEHSFMTKMPDSDRDVLKACAELLNSCAANFVGGEMPYPIALENLWWSGLKLLDSSAVMEFAERLEFENWFFLLDTGHMMNTAGGVFSEEEGIEKVLRCLGNLDSSIREKIRAVHFHCSVSGEYQRCMKEPDGFASMPESERIDILMKHLMNFDRHMPFTSPDCRRIIDCVNPDYVTHEFTGTLAERTVKLETQISALHASGMTE